MSGRVLSENERTRLQYMLDNHYTYRAMANYVGCCTDTLKRILVREDMADFEGAKYALSPSHKQPKPVSYTHLTLPTTPYV